MASNSSFDFLHVHGWQRNIVKVNMKTDNIATNSNTNAHIRPSLNDSERDHGGTSLLIMSDVCNKDGINISLTNISISSIDFLSLEKFSLLIRENNNKFDNTTNMMVNNNEQRKNSGDCLSTHNDYDKAWGISEDLHAEAKIQITPTQKERTTRDHHVGFYCLEAFSFSKDICSSEIRNGQFLDGKKERDSEKRGRLKTEISYYLPYVLELKNNFLSPLDKASKQILGSKPIHYGVKRIKSNFSENSITQRIPKHASCVDLIHNPFCTVHDNRIAVVSSEFLSKAYLCTYFHTGYTLTTILDEDRVLDLELGDIERKEIKTKKQRPFNLSIQGPMKNLDCSNCDINRCKITEYEIIKQRKNNLFEALKYLPGERSSVNILTQICRYLTLILSMIVVNSVSLPTHLVSCKRSCLSAHISLQVVIKLLYRHAKSVPIHSINSVIRLLHPATKNCSFFFLSPGKNKAETKDIANITIFKRATIVSIGRLPVALLELVIQTIKPVLCNQLTCIWNALPSRRHDVFNSIKMPNIIVRKLSSISFSILSSDRSITSSSSAKVYFSSMYSNQKIAFDALLFWVFLLLPLLTVEGSKTWDYRSNEVSSQLVYITKEYSKPELPEKEEINPVHLDVFIETNSYVKDDKLFHNVLFKLTIVKVIAKGMNENVRYKLKTTHMSQGPDQNTVPVRMEPLSDLLRQVKLVSVDVEPIISETAFKSQEVVVLENHLWCMKSKIVNATIAWNKHPHRFASYTEVEITGKYFKNEYVHDPFGRGLVNYQISSMPNINRICNGTTSLQLSNDNFVYCGATDDIQHASPSGSDVAEVEYIADDDIKTRLRRGISHFVSWSHFILSPENIFDKFETPVTTFFVPINMFPSFHGYTSYQKMLITAEAWILTFVSLMCLGLFT